MNRLEKVKGKLIVSCQALEDEPLHSSFIMGRMAYAALTGGASGIRANTVSDIQEIKKNSRTSNNRNNKKAIWRQSSIYNTYNE